MTAEILTWSRTRGLFAGISLNGATLRADEDWNRELYGRKIKLKEILVTGELKSPDAAAGLREELNRYSSRK
jgi:lipid-binding SYLF domain-containing protein